MSTHSRKWPHPKCQYTLVSGRTSKVHTLSSVAEPQMATYSSLSKLTTNATVKVFSHSFEFCGSESAFKAHRLLHHSTLGSRIIKKKRKVRQVNPSAAALHRQGGRRERGGLRVGASFSENPRGFFRVGEAFSLRQVAGL